MILRWYWSWCLSMERCTTLPLLLEATNGNQLTNCFAHGLRLLDTWSLKAKIQPINLSHIIQPRRKT